MVGNGQLSIPFTDGSNGGAAITAHKVYSGPSAGALTLLGTFSTGSPFVDTGLTNGTARYYAMSAVNSVGEGPQSAVVSGTPAAPSAPVVQTAPTIAGLAASGNTLTATPGTYTGASSVNGQWQKNGLPISGATAGTYTVGASDGPNIAYLETATNATGSVTQRALSQYMGQVATGCRQNTYYSPPNATTKTMSRARVTFKEAPNGACIVFANYMMKTTSTTPSGSTEAGSGGVLPITAAIESSDGSTILGQVKFGGAASGSIPSGGILQSDPCTFLNGLPAGDYFVRSFHTGAYGGWACNVQDTSRGEGWLSGASTADTTMTPGAISGGTAGYCYSPIAIVQPTIKPSVLIIGDSRAKGSLDAFDGATTDLGEIARCVGAAGIGYASGSTPGVSANQYVGSHADQAQIAKYCSHIHVELGINDFYNDARTVAQAQTSLTAIWGYFNQPVSQSTISPVTTSTDNWANNQSLYTTNNVSAFRISLNDWIRTKPSPLAQVIEIADIVETARDSGLWALTGSAFGITGDGLHESPPGYQKVKNASPISATTFAR